MYDRSGFDLGQTLIERLASARNRVWLMSPYVTSEVLAPALKACTARSRRLLTRFNDVDLLAGATDLKAVAAIGEAGVELRALEDVHAKVYVVDGWVYVGSANLTRRGLGPSLREFGLLALREQVLETVDFFEKVWDTAPHLTPLVLSSAIELFSAKQPLLEAEQARRAAWTLELSRVWRAPRTEAERMESPVPPTEPRSRAEAVALAELVEFLDVTPGSDHNRFMAWRRQHDDGYYLTVKSRTKANLHLASCTHQGNYDFGEFEGSATAARKICSDSADALYVWARDHELTVHGCGDCEPPGWRAG